MGEREGDLPADERVIAGDAFFLCLVQSEKRKAPNFGREPQNFEGWNSTSLSQGAAVFEHFIAHAPQHPRRQQLEAIFVNFLSWYDSLWFWERPTYASLPQIARLRSLVLESDALDPSPAGHIPSPCVIL